MKDRHSASKTNDIRAFLTPSVHIPGPKPLRQISQIALAVGALVTLLGALATAFSAAMVLLICVALGAWIIESIFGIDIQLS